MFEDYVVLIVMLLCLGIGYILRNLIPSDKINKFIPLIMGTLGVLFNVWINSWNFTPEILLGGITSGLASTGGYELVRNLIEKFSKNK